MVWTKVDPLVNAIHGVLPSYTDGEYLVAADCQRNYVHLLIVRRDGHEITSWDALQKIKNEIVGEEAIGVEVFPRESQLVNTGPMRHLWVFFDELPFGYKFRATTFAKVQQELVTKPSEKLCQ